MEPWRVRGPAEPPKQAHGSRARRRKRFQHWDPTNRRPHGSLPSAERPHSLAGPPGGTRMHPAHGASGVPAGLSAPPPSSSHLQDVAFSSLFRLLPRTSGLESPPGRPRPVRLQWTPWSVRPSGDVPSSAVAAVRPHTPRAVSASPELGRRLAVRLPPVIRHLPPPQALFSFTRHLRTGSWGDLSLDMDDPPPITHASHWTVHLRMSSDPHLTLRHLSR